MPLTCHGALKRMKDEVDLTFALAGNPNVGKSCIFNHLTGMGVVTANYPGKTVDVNLAATRYHDLDIGLVDLPGTYALGAISEAEWVARQAVLDGKPEVIIAILDATNLNRNLYLVLQFLDLGLPLVVALNLMDQAERQGIEIDVKRLSQFLGVPVVPTVATRGQGLDELVAQAVAVTVGSTQASPALRYGRDIEGAVEKLASRLIPLRERLPYGLPPRAVAILLLEEDIEFLKAVEDLPEGHGILAEARRLAAEISRRHGEPAPLRLARERYGLAGAITEKVEARARMAPLLADRLWRYTTSPWTGIPLLISVLAGIFAFLFYMGDLLSTAFSSLWTAYASPLIRTPFYLILGDSALTRSLLWGFDAGINAALAVGIPYVLTFYFILAFVEDTGYLNSVAFLTDRLMHQAGLHGRAVIPLVAGAGCNVPAILGTRVLATARERIIASTLICLVPCSARTAVILGAVSLYAGWRPALTIYLIVLLLTGLVGFGLNRTIPGRPTGLVMEMFPFRAPSIPLIMKKTWYRFRDFVFVATPIVLLGSLILGSLYETGLLWNLARPLSPLMEGWLGLPSVAGLTLIFAVLRKELALQLLVTLAMVKYGGGAKDLLYFMTKEQIFVYALVNTIYIPCVATIAVLGRELGWGRALGISGLTISLAFLVGGLARLTLGNFISGL